VENDKNEAIAEEEDKENKEELEIHKEENQRESGE
jgi:hypothetical protein